LLYTQPGILDDEKKDERLLGIEAGLNLVKRADRTVVYCNYGLSTGMKYGIENAEKSGRPIDYRELPGNWEGWQNEIIRHHSDSGLWGILGK
jgi:hypothetical protein